jgi:peroxiredoxin
VIWASKQIPASPDAARVGQLAPDFTLAGGDGKQVSLADLAKTNKGVLLIFYRGYW